MPLGAEYTNPAHDGNLQLQVPMRSLAMVSLIRELLSARHTSIFARSQVLTCSALSPLMRDIFSCRFRVLGEQLAQPTCNLRVFTFKECLHLRHDCLTAAITPLLVLPRLPQVAVQLPMGRTHAALAA